LHQSNRGFYGSNGRSKDLFLMVQDEFPSGIAYGISDGVLVFFSFWS
jgi:hypothetical protein